jgi:hypothetical protein
MGLLEVLGLKKAAAVTQAAPTAASMPAASWQQGALVQLVGASLSTPLNDPGYQLDYHLPKLLDPGPDGQAPKTYKNLTTKGQPRATFDERLTKWICGGVSFIVSYYGQDVAGANMFMWKGVRMNGLPVVAGFTPSRTEAEAREIWSAAYLAFGNVSKPTLTLASGNAGWTTFDTALKLIATPEAKVIWLTSTDAPSFPKDEQPNEAAVCLMVAHPAYDTGRTPLVYFTAPVVVPVKDMKQRERETLRVTALRESVVRACVAAGLEPKAIGTVARDCGRHTPQAAARLAEVGAALHELLPEYEVVHSGIDMPALLGELGANTVNYTLLLAAYAAHMRNHPVLYLSNRDPDAARAMLVLPPPHHTPPDPNRKFREANARGQWYSPWWGQRLDGKKDY